MRAQIRRRQRKRRLTYATVAAVAVIIAVLGVYEVTTVYRQNPMIGRVVTAWDYQQLDSLATSPNFGAVNSFLLELPYVAASPPGQSPWYVGSSPVIVFIGAEYCSNCAFMRWPLVIALLRFGNFTGLSYMQSASSGSYPNADTFSFYGSSYSSQYLVFQGFEAQTRVAGAPLQTVPSNYSSAFTSDGGSYPFIDIANEYIVSGFYPPNYLVGGQGGNWTKDIQAIGGNSTLGIQVMSSANALTALICGVTSGKPANVCTNPALAAYTGFTLPMGYTSSSGASMILDGPVASAQAWSTGQREPAVRVPP